MTRIVLENIFFFLLPTVIYIAWIAFRENRWPGVLAVLRGAPLLALFVTGAALMLSTLTLLSTRTSNQPGEAYEPPSIHDGVLQPGHSVDRP